MLSVSGSMGTIGAGRAAGRSGSLQPAVPVFNYTRIGGGGSATASSSSGGLGALEGVLYSPLVGGVQPGASSGDLAGAGSFTGRDLSGLFLGAVAIILSIRIRA